MDVVDLHPLTAVATNAPLGSEADAWFMALDSRVVRVGDDTCLLRIEGIHSCRSTLWIQVSLFEESTPGVVLQVHGGLSLHDVVETLKSVVLSGVPLEIIKIDRHWRV